MTPLQPVSQSGGHSSPSKPTKCQMSPGTVFLSAVLFLTLIGLGQRGLFDLNRLYNPHYRVCNTASYLWSMGDSCPTEQYAFRTVLIHSYLSLPLFVLFLGLSLVLRRRRLNTWQSALWRVSIWVAVFFGIEFLLELFIYLFQFHRVLGWYASLVTASVFLAILVIIIEHNRARKKSGGGQV